MTWLEERDAWITEGIVRRFLSSKVRCATHDRDPLTADEERIFEEGVDDPCIPIVRIAKEPGEAFVEGS